MLVLVDVVIYVYICLLIIAFISKLQLRASVSSGSMVIVDSLKDFPILKRCFATVDKDGNYVCRIRDPFDVYEFQLNEERSLGNNLNRLPLRKRQNI